MLRPLTSLVDSTQRQVSAERVNERCPHSSYTTNEGSGHRKRRVSLPGEPTSPPKLGKRPTGALFLTLSVWCFPSFQPPRTGKRPTGALFRLAAAGNSPAAVPLRGTTHLRGAPLNRAQVRTVKRGRAFPVAFFISLAGSEKTDRNLWRSSTHLGGPVQRDGRRAAPSTKRRFCAFPTTFLVSFGAEKTGRNLCAKSSFGLTQGLHVSPLEPTKNTNRLSSRLLGLKPARKRPEPLPIYVFGWFSPHVSKCC